MLNNLIGKLIKDKPIANAAALTIFVVIESLQFLIILGLVYSFNPVLLPDYMKDLPPKLLKGFRPEREIFFYRSFLVIAIMGQIALMSFFKHRKMDIPRESLLQMALVDGALVLVELFAVFKIWQYDNPWWARDLLYSAIGAWLLIRVFWGEYQQGIKLISEVMMAKQKILRSIVDGCVPVLLFVCLWVPDVQKILGRIFVWDQFRNWDSTIMLPAWAHSFKEGLNTDIYSSWGMGAVIFIGHCSKVLGGLDYVHALLIVMAMVIIYYGFLYAFLKIWLGSILLATAVLAVAVKVQMFHAGISPLIWIFPQDTPIRHWLDIPVFWCLWQYARLSQGKYLVWTALWIGAAMAWVLSTGLCLLVAFWGFLIFLMLVPEYRKPIIKSFKEIRKFVFYCLLPLVVMVLLLFLIQGSMILHSSFWKNMAEPFQLFLKGAGTLSIYTCLYDRHFFAFIAGFVIPVIYVWSLIVMASLFFAKKAGREDLFMIPLCIYGLSLYIHYLAHASISHYYAVGIPVVMVLGYWFSKILQQIPPAMGKKTLLLVVIVAWGALLTNILFVYYPNIIDISRMDWKPEIDFYQSQFKFDQDAAMIARLTPDSQGAPIIGSFETKLLMQANRKPFFYYAPLVISQRTDINGFAGTSVTTQERLARTIRQIAQESPEYIFVEKKLLGQWPQEYVQRYPGIIVILQYILAHYVPQEQGTYLIAFRKK